MAIYGSLGDIDVGAIDKSISDTASDIFVYDTRKDSDGGAWRKRTQHTSWYNETLNTATRGARREFPAVAVIVAETSKVTIYDGDDPDMPMWMVFNTTDGSMLRSGQIISISMLNAELWVGHASGSGVHWVNFLKDTARWLTGSSSYGGYYGQVPNSGGTTILDRNTSGGNYYNNIGGASDITIAGSSINDVAMTVLPNALIDSTTGLPVPTIAVATDGGVSVIKDDGTIANINPGASSVVTFDKNNGLWINFNSGGSGIGWYYYTNFTSTSSLSSIYHNNSGWSSNWDMLGGVYYRGLSYGYSSLTTGTLGLSNFDGFGAIKATTTMSNFITTSYNTGWMHGDIEGAFLSDTSTASVTGTELITNGTFSTSDLSAWTTITGGTAVITGGLLKLTDTSNAFVYASAPFTTVIGQKYVVTFDIVNNGDNTANYNYVRIGNSHNSTEHHDTNYGTAYGKYQVTITATATTTYITLINGLTNGYFGYWDNVSARLAEKDRSVNNKGLQVFGTIAKTPVATGADLVGYSGFSSSNFLYQPYNSALDFGTGDFCYMCWVMDDSVGSGAVIFQRGTAVNSNETVFYIDSSYRLIGRVQTTSGLTSNVCFVEDQWNHCVFLRRSGTIQIYHNGILQGSATNTETATQVGQGLSIGAWLTNNYYFPTSISLFRVSASAPSPEQILKIYNDEKMLFQENSQATLYGASDAVTALAYDDDNQLLHVGTSSGRSDFQGLRRINNTTTAVTTAISASNGLIAEQ